MKRFGETQSMLMDLETAIEFYNQYGSTTVCHDGKAYCYYDEKKGD